jgi:hypothetical protein
MIQRLIVFLLIVLSLNACNRDVTIQPLAGTATVTVTLSEADVNTVIANVLADAANPLLRDPVVDLQNGQIVISGEHDRRDGAGRVAGRFTVVLAVTNGTLSAQVTDASIEGLELSDERITQFNGALQARLTGRAREQNARAILDRVTVTDDTLQIQIVIQAGE